MSAAPGRPKQANIPLGDRAAYPRDAGQQYLPRHDAFDLLATMVALARPDGQCLLVNAALEDAVGASRRTLLRSNVLEWLTDAVPLRENLRAVAANEVATSRFDAMLKRGAVGLHEPLSVHVIVTQTDRADQLLIEMIEIEQQTRQDREERALGLAQANKELVRNLAHEIKNPLGGIRGAAQLLAMEIGQPQGEPRTRGAGSVGTAKSRGLTEYTDVIIHEADRLQALVDRLLAPHRRPHVVGDVNIHEVCERVRSLVLAEHPRGLVVKRDYDTSIPEFRGDREQLIQAVLNVVHNASQALAERITAGDARIVLRTRIARQVTIGKERFRLALELHVEDNGPGVPETLRDRIFHPLVSGRDGGSGLGLTLAQTFVQQHLGTIACQSEPGRTVFSIIVPLP
jgi:two-component system nitrogen regulation sensor histidine kinase GlnL